MYLFSLKTVFFFKIKRTRDLSDIDTRYSSIGLPLGVVRNIQQKKKKNGDINGRSTSTWCQMEAYAVGVVQNAW